MRSQHAAMARAKAVAAARSRREVPFGGWVWGLTGRGVVQRPKPLSAPRLADRMPGKVAEVGFLAIKSRSGRAPQPARGVWRALCKGPAPWIGQRRQ